MLSYIYYNRGVEIEQFREIIWQKGHELYRDMPWRRDTRAYYVLVSELMLQQTQVSRVIPKFEAFIQRFPTERALAMASLSDVLILWNGLGYNRRAKFLHEAAKQIVDTYDGIFPSDRRELLALPGVGVNTTGALQAYAFNQPALFIETNIRTVYFHHFFVDGDIVDDQQISELLQATIDHEHPREFYWALMDYGSWLKTQGMGRIHQSKHYKKQSPLKGSIREVRGMIVRHLAHKDEREPELRSALAADERFQPALDGLVRDGLVVRDISGKLHLTK